MASVNNIIQAMNNITLDDEEEGGIAIDETEYNQESDMLLGNGYSTMSSW